MSIASEFAARLAYGWLNRFRSRNGLGRTLPDFSLKNYPNWERRPGEQLLLHVGCGHSRIGSIHLSGFQNSPWREVRLDADESVMPDIVGSMTEMPYVPDNAVNAVFSSHGIEHLYWHDVPNTLAEFRRVLRDDGFLVVTCPDLQAVAQMIVEDRLLDTAYISAAGPITPFDIVFGYRPVINKNSEWMAHRSGFTLTTLMDEIRKAGFANVHGVRRTGDLDLWALGTKSPRTAEEMTALAADYLPTVA